jgi:hypothetical protein
MRKRKRLLLSALSFFVLALIYFALFLSSYAESGPAGKGFSIIAIIIMLVLGSVNLVGTFRERQ